MDSLYQSDDWSDQYDAQQLFKHCSYKLAINLAVYWCRFDIICLGIDILQDQGKGIRGHYMNKPVIEINNLSKSYLIGHEAKAAPGTLTLRGSLAGIIKKPIEILTGHRIKKEKFWALKDVNLSINQGDVVGIIGRNGSGKSTMLKVLSRIVEPTSGEIIMRGKAASLLEVGTGFHPELTGRENIYFNGSILGMKKKEIDAKFDEIVAFSEVEKFLDTPVKFYSSGMYVRLAFSVAAHLEPDILIVDEVLAVGDAAFQKKCLGKMQDVAGEGRTVLFVSHSMESVQSLCNKAVLMDSGRAVEVGDVDSVYKKYLGRTKKTKAVFSNFRNSKSEKHAAKIDKITLYNSIGKKTTEYSHGEELNIKIDLDLAQKSLKSFRIDINIFNEEGHRVACLTGTKKYLKAKFVEIKIPKIMFSAGTYIANISLVSTQNTLEHFIEDAFYFDISSSIDLISGSSNAYYDQLEIK